MDRPGSENWFGPALAGVICFLTPLVSPYVSMFVGAAAMVGMAIFYSRRRRSWVRGALVFAIALAVSMALVYWLTRN